ncbi:MAG TPA: QsdR family transcriptional regulator [Actinomycetes bacterium]|jgi:AcrR family transcriptional regulator|nr:QsdR family transcriptional regulator [Actinomycetes bacterium]
MGRAVSSQQRSSALTLLERELAGERKAPVTPLDAFRAARRRFLRSERIDMGNLAAELGIGRATLYRWVGGRDRLLGEILWSLAEGALRRCREEAEGEGADWVIDIYTRFGRLIVETAPLLHFVRSEPETALRVMTTRHSPNQARVVEFFRDALEEAAATRGLKLRLDAHTLAYVLVRVAESFLWTDLITGEPPDQSKAEEVARVLLG